MSRLAGRTQLKSVLLFTVVLCFAVGARSQTELLDGVAAVVNDKTILISDVKGAAAQLYLKFAKTYAGQELEAKYQEACREKLDDLIEDFLILTTCEKPDPTLLETLAEAEIDRIVRDEFDGDRTAFVTDLTKKQATLEEVRKVIADRVIISLARRREVTSKIAVSPGAVRARYEANIDKYKVSSKVKLRMIVLHKGGTEKDTELKRQTALLLKKRIETGADFASLASFSEDMRREKGGDWGWMECSSLRSELARAISKLKVGAASQVVETEDGFYLLKVDGRRGESVASLENVREEIERELRREQYDHIYRAWIDRLRKRSYVKVLGFGEKSGK